MTKATLADMRQTARDLADMEDVASISDEWLNRRINEHCQRLYDKLIIAHGDLYYAKSNNGVSAVVGQSTYTWADLGAQDFYRLVSLIVDNGNDWCEPPAFQYEDLPSLLEQESGVGYWHPCQLRRMVKPTGVEIRPAPNSTSLNITLHYIPVMPKLVDDQHAFDGINGWERWACLGAAIDMRVKEDEDPSGLYAMRQEIDRDIDILAGTRDAGRPYKVRRTRRRYRYGRYGEDD